MQYKLGVGLQGFLITYPVRDTVHRKISGRDIFAHLEKRSVQAVITQEQLQRLYLIMAHISQMMVDAFASVTEPVIHGECLYMMDQESLCPSR
mmetsp:Transcript_1029/g.2133  ORF Transcript_1029/g.2133 Transcript_1029/m.2133 type:complete len:93 (-) Transcript_1029:153-431(-)